MGAKLRTEGFKFADPNGNGLCSLAEIDNFVLRSLLAAYPKSGDEEPGRDLYDAFHPCIIRAYIDAKDIMPDTGEQLDGTTATADDFLSWGEFRFLNSKLKLLVRPGHATVAS